ncbi:DUF4192 domain-containing protein [Phycicoccus duodecadis]|uniref:Uncharacterized protein DUF4192 n=1 Tax=Phycicoccus duodecadis TaxID=173053 RepID=A0A2N3YFQ3_9MICO|nr:DUF4192 domain-containing protein [Phycicoccus duodecadis]PKW25687.1 uncharacterized protein DUF4192 [Phycicoccus duodecadis]
MTAPIRLRDPGDVLATLPYQLGYHPRRSAVVVALQQGRIAGVVRCDLPPPDIPPGSFVGGVVQPLVREGMRRVLVLGYEDEPDESEPFLRALVEGLEREGVVVAEVYVMRDGRRYSPTCSGACCPLEGVPVPAAADVPAVADLVALGSAPLASREAVDRVVDPPPGTAWRAGGVRGGPRGSRQARRCGVRAWAALLGPTADGPRPVEGSAAWSNEVRVAAGALADIQLRDALIAWMAPGLLPRHELDPPVVALLERMMPRWAGAGSWRADSGDPGEQRRMLDLLLGVCRGVPDDRPGEAAAVCTTAAQVAWSLGDGALARAALDRAVRLEPGYRLAVLLGRMVDAGLRPAARRLTAVPEERAG